MGRSSQAKGRRAEIELAQVLRAYGLPDACPGSPFNYGTQADVSGVPGLHIECKRHERLEVCKWYEQAQQDAARMQDGKPVVIYRQNRKPWMILLSLHDFMDLVKEAEHGESDQ